MKKLNKYLLDKISLTLGETLTFAFLGISFVYFATMLIIAIVNFMQYFA